jgi:hypothetical protein
MEIRKAFIVDILDANEQLITKLPIFNLREAIYTWQSLLFTETCSIDGKKFHKAVIKIKSSNNGEKVNPSFQSSSLFDFRDLQILVKEYNQTVIPEIGEKELELVIDSNDSNFYELILPNEINS